MLRIPGFNSVMVRKLFFALCFLVLLSLVFWPLIIFWPQIEFSPSQFTEEWIKISISGVVLVIVLDRLWRIRDERERRRNTSLHVRSGLLNYAKMIQVILGKEYPWTTEDRIVRKRRLSYYWGEIRRYRTGNVIQQIQDGRVLTSLERVLIEFDDVRWNNLLQALLNEELNPGEYEELLKLIGDFVTSVEEVLEENKL